MTNQPDTETARALMWRHGLPEDVIDGALALIAQELAGKIRAHRDHTRGAVQATKVMDFAADLISPENWARTDAAVSAVAPATDRAALREMAADALADAEGWQWAPGYDKAQSPTYQHYLRQADTVLSVLPANTDRAAVLAEVDWIIEHCPEHGCVEPETEVCHCEIAERLRRVATEVRTAKQDEAHPAEHWWAAELHDPAADEWVPGTRYLVRERAVNALAHAKRVGPAWKDGTPTERRLVRATTTYTVEPTPEQPAGGAQQPKETGL